MQGGICDGKRNPEATADLVCGAKSDTNEHADPVFGSGAFKLLLFLFHLSLSLSQSVRMLI